MAIRAFRQALGRLEQIREGSAGGDAASNAAADAASIVEKIVLAAATDAEQFVATVAAEAEVRLARLEHEVAAAREAQSRAESALDEHRGGYEARLRAAEAQAVAARAETEVQRLEVARLSKMLQADAATRARLFDALQTIQQVVAPNQLPAAASSMSQPVDVPATASRQEKPAKGLPLKLVTSQPATISRGGRELEEYVVQLFEQIQSAYDADAKATQDGAALVDRLKQNIRHAYGLFLRRAESTHIDHSTAFEDHLNTLLNTQGESAYIRHLGIASYCYANPEGASNPSNDTAV